VDLSTIANVVNASAVTVGVIFCGDDDSKPLDWFQSLISKGGLGLLKKK
jgi:hypothetical protein